MIIEDEYDDITSKTKPTSLAKESIINYATLKDEENPEKVECDYNQFE